MYLIYLNQLLKLFFLKKKTLKTGNTTTNSIIKTKIYAIFLKFLINKFLK